LTVIEVSTSGCSAIEILWPDRLDRLGHLDLATRDLEAGLVEDLREIPPRDRPVKLAGFSSLADDDERLAVELDRDGFSFTAHFQIARL
jgi:hypothetical protein